MISLRHSLLLLLFAALLMMPAVVLGPGGGDLHCQSIYTRLFSAQFWQGDLYPRWLQDMFAGDGAPVFFYYPPVTYYITALFSFLAPLDFYGYYPIAFSVFLAVLASGVTFHAWMKEETNNPEGALIGGLLYMAAYNHVADNFYGLLLFSTMWAYAWLPLLMLLAHRVADGRPYSVAAFAFMLAVLIMTNLPITLISGPVIVAYGLLYLRREQWRRQAARLGLGVAFGFGLAAIFLAPALFYSDYVNIDFFWKTARGHIFKASNLFFILFHSLDCRMRIFLWFISAFLLMAYLHAGRRKHERFFFLGIALLSLFMMLPVSAPLWTAVPGLKMLQMSERFFVLTSLALAVFATWAFPRLRFLSWGMVAVYLALTWFVASQTRMTVAKDETNSLWFEAYKLNIDQYAVYLTSPELWDRYTNIEIDWLKTHPEKVNVIHGDAKIDIRKWEPRLKVMHVTATRDTLLRVRQFYYPGYQAFLDDKELDITHDDGSGRILLNVPAGEGDIRLELTALVPEETGKAISLARLGALLLMVLAEARMRGKKTLPVPP